MVLLIDNYDSFTYNLAHLFGEQGWEVDVRRNDAITVEEARALAPSHLVISPGPGTPADSGVSRDMIRAKLARIYSGKPSETDHWTDIIGYATIALKIMERVNRKGV